MKTINIIRFCKGAILSVIAALPCGNIYAQNLSAMPVETVENETVTETDQNGDPRSLLIVNSPLQNLKFRYSGTNNEFVELPQEEGAYKILYSGRKPKIEVVAEGFIPLVFPEFQSKPGGVYSTTVDKPKGFVTIPNSNEIDRILIEGRPYSYAEFAATPFDVGPLNVRFVTSDGDTHDDQIMVQADVMNVYNFLPDNHTKITVSVITDPDALVLIDKKKLRPVSENDKYRYFEISPGAHEIMSILPLKKSHFPTSGQFNDTVGRVERMFFTNRNNSVDMRHTGSLIITKPSSNDYGTVWQKMYVDQTGTISQREGSILPKEESRVDCWQVNDLMGNYQVKFSASDYKDKSYRFSVLPGEEARINLKMDPIRPFYFALYSGFCDTYAGLELATCGKYIGAYIRGAMLGDRDPEKEGDKSFDSWNVAAGPMFCVLRTPTRFYISAGIGYQSKYYTREQTLAKDPLKSLTAEAAILIKLKSKLTLQLGYLYPINKHKDFQINYKNIQFGIGWAI